jgi:GT2 family glycosyltransferase
MAVDVVVVNYRTYGDLERFCDSWLEAKFEGCTLTVVDVEGAARLGDEVRSHHQIDHWINTEENCGYARACNFGAAHGTNDVILLANADTLLTPALWDCYLALRSHADWGVLGPRQVDDRGAITAGGIFGTDTNIGQRGWQELDRGQYSDVRDDAKSVSGSLYFIKRALWEELTECEVMQKAYPDIRGAFIPTPHYYEETCCSYHARAHGYKIVYYGPVQMTHLWHRASPHGGKADSHVETSKAMMREFCRMHNISCE